MILLLIFISLIGFTSSQKKIVCYYSNWAQYRPDGGKFLPQNINPNLCTHINYAFAFVSNDQLIPYEWNDEDNNTTLGMYRKVIMKKIQNPKLKVLISAAGWNMDSITFSQMASNKTRRGVFISSVVELIKKYKFDGLDLNYKYPYGEVEKINFLLLVKELSDVLRPSLLLTSAVSPLENIIIRAYNISELMKYLDYVNLLAFDFNGPWDMKVGHNAPLYKRLNDSLSAQKLNVDAAVKYWLSNGAIKDKIVVGLAAYGNSFKLSDPKKYLPGSANMNLGISGPYTNEIGMLSYYEICSLIQEGWTREWDSEQCVPYLHYNEHWISYDDAQSLTEKVNYVKQNQLGGVTWTLDLDDFSNSFCNKGEYPLLNMIYDEMNSNTTTISPNTPLTSSTKTTLRSTTTLAITKFASPTTFRVTTTSATNKTATTQRLTTKSATATIRLTTTSATTKSATTTLRLTTTSATTKTTTTLRLTTTSATTKSATTTIRVTTTSATTKTTTTTRLTTTSATTTIRLTTTSATTKTTTTLRLTTTSATTKSATTTLRLTTTSATTTFRLTTSSATTKSATAMLRSTTTSATTTIRLTTTSATTKTTTTLRLTTTSATTKSATSTLRSTTTNIRSATTKTT